MTVSNCNWKWLGNVSLHADKINIVHHTPSESLKTYLSERREILCLHVFVVPPVLDAEVGSESLGRCYLIQSLWCGEFQWHWTEVFYFLLPNNSVVQLCLLDDFPPGVSANESRRGGQAVESDVYSKPLRGHVSSPTLRFACVKGAVWSFGGNKYFWVCVITSII